MSDDAIARRIGAFVRHHRLAQNRSQDAVAQEAGISRSTLSLLERGAPVTLATLIQVLRVLRQLHVFDGLTIRDHPSPLELAREQRSARQRASGSRSDSTNPGDDGR